MVAPEEIKSKATKMVNDLDSGKSKYVYGEFDRDTANSFIFCLRKFNGTYTGLSYELNLLKASGEITLGVFPVSIGKSAMISMVSKYMYACMGGTYFCAECGKFIPSSELQMISSFPFHKECLKVKK